MSSLRVAVVSKQAPGLKSLDSSAARKFLRDYISYEHVHIRLDESEAQVPMKRCIEHEDLTVLQDNSVDLPVEVVKVARGAATTRTRITTPLTHMSAGGAIIQERVENEEEKREEEDEDSLDSVLYMSNAHIEEMVLHVLGPRTPHDSLSILREVNMAEDAPFTKWGTATNYAREWKETMQWCKHQLPLQKVMVEQFLKPIKPRQLSLILKNMGYKKMAPLMKTFVDEYRRRVDASNLLLGMGVLVAETPKAATTQKSTPKATAPSSKPEKGESKDESKSKKTGKVNEPETPKACYHCGDPSHMRPDCPKFKADKKMIKAIHHGVSTDKRLNLTVDLGGPGQQCLSIIANLDTAADPDCAGRNIAPMLELHGGTAF